MNPIVQNGLVPVFLDVKVPTYNIDVTHLEEAVGPRTRAIMIAHTLGNPFDLGAVTAFAKRHGLWLVEDCCDAVGGTYGGRPVAWAAAIEAVAIIRQPAFLAHARRLGDVMREVMEGWKAEWPIVGDVRGLGPMMLAEFVRSATPRSTTTRPMMSRNVGLDLELDRLVERVVEATGCPGDRPWR